jgi:hypothetical protein
VNGHVRVPAHAIACELWQCPPMVAFLQFLGLGERPPPYPSLGVLTWLQILNASLNIPNYFPDDFVYCNIRIEDNDKEDIGTHSHAYEMCMCIQCRPSLESQ